MKNRIMRQRKELKDLSEDGYYYYHSIDIFCPEELPTRVVDLSHHKDSKVEVSNELELRIKDLELEREEDHEYIDSLEKQLAKTELLVEKMCQNLDMEVNHVPTKY